MKTTSTILDIAAIAGGCALIGVNIIGSMASDVTTSVGTALTWQQLAVDVGQSCPTMNPRTVQSCYSAEQPCGPNVPEVCPGGGGFYDTCPVPGTYKSLCVDYSKDTGGPNPLQVKLKQQACPAAMRTTHVCIAQQFGWTCGNQVQIERCAKDPQAMDGSEACPAGMQNVTEPSC